MLARQVHSVPAQVGLESPESCKCFFFFFTYFWRVSKLYSNAEVIIFSTSMKVPSVCHDLPLVQALKSHPGNYPDVKLVAVKMEMDTGD